MTDALYLSLVTDHAPQQQALIVLRPAHADVWTGECRHGSESESRTRGLTTADPTQHLPAYAVADLWSESAD